MLALLASPRSDSRRWQSVSSVRSVWSSTTRLAASRRVSSMAYRLVRSFMGAQRLQRGELRHQVVVHQLLGTRRLLALDRGEQCAVLADRLLDAAGPVELASAQQAHEAAQVVGRAVEPAVRGERLHLAVKGVVGAVVAVDIARGGVLLERVVQAAQLL